MGGPLRCAAALTLVIMVALQLFIMRGRPFMFDRFVLPGQPNSSCQPLIGTLAAYRHALARMGKTRALNMTTAVVCPPAFEIGWRQPADLLPMFIGNKCEPWWTRDAVYLLDQIIRSDWTAVEWGSGSSTVWLASRVGALTTIEDSGEWVEILRSKLADPAFGLSNIDLRHRPSASNGKLKSASRGCCYDDYIHGAEDLPTGSQDLVSVDGRAREHCLKEAVRLLRPEGGVLLLDNSVRPRYADAISKEIPAHWVRHDTVHPRTPNEKQQFWIARDDLQTTFWISKALVSCSSDKRCEEDIAPELV